MEIIYDSSQYFYLTTNFALFTTYRHYLWGLYKYNKIVCVIVLQYYFE